jgi:hypothetical protein
MAYATYSDVETRIGRTFSTTEKNTCTSLLNRAALMIDSYSAAADKSDDVKKEVSINMVSRVMADTSTDIPVGASQGSMSGLGYAQSWTIGNGGSVGELYIGKADKKLLGIGNQIGSYSPVEDLVKEGTV